MQGCATIRVRVARASDVPAIENCIAAAYRGYIDRIGSRPAAMDRDFRPLVEAGNVFVCELSGALIALMVVTSCVDHVEVSSVAVSPTAQGRGFGRRLMTLAEQIALSRGFHVLRLYTNAALPELVTYYEQLGYRALERKFDGGYDRVYLEKVLSRDA